MKVAVAQFAAGADWRANLAACRVDRRAEAEHADLLVLPEGVLARFPGVENRIVQAAQPLDGPFVSGLVARTADAHVTVVFGVHEVADGTRVFNTLIAARGGRVIASYRKLHLYDAFSSRESDNVIAGSEIPPLFDCAGWTVGMMTCYDVRFPELARVLTDRGAELLALPAAWVRGPAKERHWEVMVAARALENTCFVAASGECGVRNIGASMIVDPLATVIARLDEHAGLAMATVHRDGLARARTALPVLKNRRLAVDPRDLRAPRHRPRLTAHPRRRPRDHPSAFRRRARPGHRNRAGPRRMRLQSVHHRTQVRFRVDGRRRARRRRGEPREVERGPRAARCPARGQSARPARLISVNSGSFPPYEIVGSDGRRRPAPPPTSPSPWASSSASRSSTSPSTGCPASWPASTPAGTTSPSARSATSPTAKPPPTSWTGSGVRGLRGAQGQPQAHRLHRRHLRAEDLGHGRRIGRGRHQGASSTCTCRANPPYRCSPTRTSRPPCSRSAPAARTPSSPRGPR